MVPAISRVQGLILGAVLVAGGELLFCYSPVVPGSATAAMTAIGFLLWLIGVAALLAGGAMLLGSDSRTGLPYRGGFLIMLVIAGLCASAVSSARIKYFLEDRVESLSEQPGLSIMRFVLQDRMATSKPAIGEAEVPSVVSDTLGCILRDYRGREPNAKETCKAADGYFAKKFLDSFVPAKSDLFLTDLEYQNVMRIFLPSNDNEELAKQLQELTVSQEICRAVRMTNDGEGTSAVDFLGKSLAAEDCSAAAAQREAKSRYLVTPTFNIFFGSSHLPLWRLLTNKTETVGGNHPSRAFLFGSELDRGEGGFDKQVSIFEARYALIDAVNRQFRELGSAYSSVGNLFLGWVQLLVYMLFIAGVAQLFMIVQAQANGTAANWRDRNIGKENPFEYLGNVRLAFASYIDANIPRLGFIGTVLGISAALGTAHRIVDPQLSPIEQADQIQVVVGLLGVAFNTTFVALVLGVLYDVGFRLVISREVSNAPGADNDESKEIVT